MKQSPRSWQIRALESWRRGHLRGIAKVVTGGGKTTFAGMCANGALARNEIERVVIVVPTLALADQWYVVLAQDFDIPVKDLAIWSGRSKDHAIARWTITTFATAAKKAVALAEGGRALLVVDECHHAGAPTFLALADQRWAATLGLSATPEREYDTTFEDVIEPVLGPVVIEYSYSDALKDGVICPFSLVNMKVQFTSDESADYAKVTKAIAVAISKEGVDDPKLKGLLRKRARISAMASSRSAVAVKVILANRGARMMIFDESIDRIEVIAEFLKSKGIAAATYHSRMGHQIARDNFAAYRIGHLQVLLTVHALDEGANVPETEIAVIIAATSSARQRIQRLGRVLRPARGKEAAKIFTLFATESEERVLRMPTAASSVEWQEAR